MKTNRIVSALLGMLLTKAAVLGAWYLYNEVMKEVDKDFQDDIKNKPSTPRTAPVTKKDFAEQADPVVTIAKKDAKSPVAKAAKKVVSKVKKEVKEVSPEKKVPVKTVEKPDTQKETKPVAKAVRKTPAKKAKPV